MKVKDREFLVGSKTMMDRNSDESSEQSEEKTEGQALQVRRKSPRKTDRKADGHDAVHVDGKVNGHAPDGQATRKQKVELMDGKVRKPASPSAFLIEVGERLRKLREDDKRISPEDLSKRTRHRGSIAEVSPSYIRRVEKAEHSPSIEVLQSLLVAMGTNAGSFFDYLIESESAGYDKKFARMLQRGLDGPDRKFVEATMYLIDKGAAKRAMKKEGAGNNK